jgi:hypothetical protein
MMPAEITQDIMQYMISDSRNPLDAQSIELFLTPETNVLNLSYNPKVDIKLAQKIVEKCPNIHTLILNSCIKLTDDALEIFLHAYKNTLIALDLSRTFNISSKSLQILQEMPKLKHLSLRCLPGDLLCWT